MGVHFLRTRAASSSALHSGSSPYSLDSWWGAAASGGASETASESPTAAAGATAAPPRPGIEGPAERTHFW